MRALKGLHLAVFQGQLLFVGFVRAFSWTARDGPEWSFLGTRCDCVAAAVAVSNQA